MRGRYWTEVGAIAALLLSGIVVSQICGSSIAVLDGFHTMFLLLNTVYTSLSHQWPSSGLHYSSIRAQPVGVFLSYLVLLTLNTIYLNESCTAVIEPAAAQRPLLLVAAGAVSLTLKMLLVVLHWPRSQSRRGEPPPEPHIEVNHRAEETAQAEQGAVLNNNTECKGSLDNPTLIIINTEALVEARTQHQTNGTRGQHSNGETPPKDETPPEIKGAPHSLSSCLLHICETLLTPILVLVYGLFTLSFNSKCHNSKLCPLLIYLDPMLSLLAAVLLISKSIPQVFRYGQILLLGTPCHLSVAEIGKKIADVQGVKTLHELHVWKLAEGFIVASVHVQCCTSLQNRCPDVVLEVTKVLQGVGVTCSTVQPEFRDQETSADSCGLACGETCTQNMCCSQLEEQHKTTRRTKEEASPDQHLHTHVVR
ncbi:unnamed protein product [Knipowitschia caucasica]